MAPKKKTAARGAFAPANVERSFAHPDGRTYAIQVIDCRLYEHWTNADQGGGSNTSTRDSDAEAEAFAWKKVDGLLKKGYVEAKTRQARVCDLAADVVEMLRSSVDYKGEPVDDYQPLDGRPNVFLAANISVHVWLITSDDRRRAVKVSCKTYQSELPPGERDAMADALLDLMVARRDELFGDAKTPVRKWPLPAPAGRFTHLVVLSPSVVNQQVRGKFTISRSVFRAFPAFDCEMSEADTVTMAEGRTAGHASLPYATWDRAPHPIVDLAYLKKSADAPEFLIYDPREVDKRLGGTLANLSGTEVRARNHRGEVRSFFKNQTPPDRTELRGFFGFDP